jgi:hypothetical protein
MKMEVTERTIRVTWPHGATSVKSGGKDRRKHRLMSRNLELSGSLVAGALPLQVLPNPIEERVSRRLALVLDLFRRPFCLPLLTFSFASLSGGLPFLLAGPLAPGSCSAGRWGRPPPNHPAGYLVLSFDSPSTVRSDRRPRRRRRRRCRVRFIRPRGWLFMWWRLINIISWFLTSSSAL